MCPCPAMPRSTWSPSVRTVSGWGCTVWSALWTTWGGRSSTCGSCSWQERTARDRLARWLRRRSGPPAKGSGFTLRPACITSPSGSRWTAGRCLTKSWRICKSRARAPRTPRTDGAGRCRYNGIRIHLLTRRWRPSVSAHLGAQRGGPCSSAQSSYPARRGRSTRDDKSRADGAGAPRVQPAGDSGCGLHRARATARINWLECCRHLPTPGLFLYPLRATDAQPESHL